MTTAFVVAPPMRAASGDELAALLGEDRWAALQRLLLERAIGAVNAVAADCEVHVVAAPPRPDEMGKRLRDAVDATATQGPLVILWPTLPRWKPDHLAGALGDLEDGCAVSVAPIFDGGIYLLAMRRPIARLFELDDDALLGPRAMGTLLGAAGEQGSEVGLLRAERALRRPADVAAALADPLLDRELRELLRA
jgi:glycosyltransferase A (GT-A) superfamily protein (DUF2064 family)